ncbi:isochorismatase family protein [Pseudooceanicola onchidii]|uniref:isochorismatase family protein n=1 Tax=Pseudooceanicola onchidii TaxID=2562279 RepID=UPI0010AA5CE3|nr:isochorismatase family protein [Pseudooceanicola onchidii]
MQVPLTLPLSRTALLPIDLQEEHRTDPRYLVEGYAEVLGRVGRLLGQARAAGLRVVHAGFRRDFARVPPRPFEPLSADGSAAFSDLNDPATAFCPEVAPIPGEPVIWKNDLSCFSDPDFAPTVAGIEWLVICGVWTEACVAATVRDAIARGIRVLLVKDAVGSGTVAMSQSGVINLANRLYGGAVCDTDMALALMTGAERQVWRLQGSAPLRYTGGDIARVWRAL